MGVTVGCAVSLGAGRFLGRLAFKGDIPELGATLGISRRLVRLLGFPEYRH